MGGREELTGVVHRRRRLRFLAALGMTEGAAPVMHVGYGVGAVRVDSRLRGNDGGVGREALTGVVPDLGALDSSLRSE